MWLALLLAGCVLFLGCTRRPADPSIKYTLAEYLAAMRPSHKE